jgi:hypothetical protein
MGSYSKAAAPVFDIVGNVQWTIVNYYPVKPEKKNQDLFFHK